MPDLSERKAPGSRSRSPFGSAIAFTLLTFAASWLLWTAGFAIQERDLSLSSGFMPIGGSLYLLGVFAPALVAVALTRYAAGSSGLQALLRQTLSWDVGARWYLIAVLYFASVKLVLALVYRLALGGWPAFNQTPLAVMLAATAISVPVQAGEEVGWRGYLLPRVSARFGLPAASLIVGVIWAWWHLPFFFIAGTDKWGQSFPIYGLGVIALSVTMAWLYWRTRGSLLLTMVMHAAVNNTNLVQTPASSSSDPWTINTSFTAWGTVVLLWIPAVSLLVAMRGATLTESVGATGD
jgi:CAAX protease family protein